jgi:tetratricopeptide (TPR) repeat protein
MPNRFDMRPTNTDAGNTVHLPDNGLAQSEVGPGPVPQNNIQRVNPGRIDIVVSPANPPARTTTGSTAASPSDSSFDSRNRKGAAERARSRGDYRTATREYLKALDGAGDDAADIHYQLGRCYQFLEENDSAITHYNDAIVEYKKVAASGKNAEEANRQIKRCEAGIRACQ